MTDSAPNKWRYISRSLRSTHRFAAAIARQSEKGSVYCLNGDLGAGKTAFTKGFAEGHEVKNLKDVVSPTYTLVNEYDGQRSQLFHMDWYRLEDEEAALSLGLEEVIRRREGVVLVEWSIRFPEFVPSDAISVDIRVLEDQSREFTRSGTRPPARFKVLALD
jgi:tRNA threonylcarbamoyladenosine biosynthesis protein TsaE